MVCFPDFSKCNLPMVSVVLGTELWHDAIFFVPAIARWAAVRYDMCTSDEMKRMGVPPQKMPNCTPEKIKSMAQELHIVHKKPRVGGVTKSPRREVVRSSAGAGVVYPPFWGVIRVSYPKA